MNAKLTRSAGFSLVELMVAMVAGLIVSGAALAFFFSSMKSNGEYVQSTRLTQELRNTMGLLTRGLQRAGYDENALKYMGTGTATPFTRIMLVANTCVIYSYDKLGGTAGALDVGNGEVLALRRVAVTNLDGRNVGVIEFATSFGSTKPTCGAANADYTTYPPTCNATTGWCALSDPTSLDVTGLTFTDGSVTVGTTPNLVRLRQIGVNLAGQLAGSPIGYSRSMQTNVRVRSDCYDATIGNCSISP